MWEYKATDYKNDFVRHGDHKYIKKFMRAGKWVYEYPISGKGYYDDSVGSKQFRMQRESHELRELAQINRNRAKELGPNGRYQDKEGRIYSSGNYTHAANARENKANEIDQKLHKAKRDYNNKSLAGISKKTARRIGRIGNKTINSLSRLVNKGSKGAKRKKKKPRYEITVN